jgi:hypothetical protein
MKRTAWRRTVPLSLAAGAALFGLPALAVSYDLAVDVPSTLGGTDYEPHQIVRSDAGTYGLDLELPAGTRLSSLHRTPDDLWLFSPSEPVELDAVTYEPRDVVAWDGSVYSMHLDGSAAGVEPGARIDALFLDAAGRTVLSFDVPVRLDGSFFQRSDLVVREATGFSGYWDADTAGVPAGSNLVGAGEDDTGALVLTFDVPTTLGSAVYLPGQLVRWEGGTSFGSYFQDAAWPAGSQLRDFAFAPVAAGAVPDGVVVPGTQLRVDKGSGGQLLLTWGPSCLGTDSDYEVYEGTLGDFSSHTPVTCSTGGATVLTVTPDAGSVYYLAVPRNGMREGSYGTDSSLVERTPSASACLIQEIGACD